MGKQLCVHVSLVARVNLHLLPLLHHETIQIQIVHQILVLPVREHDVGDEEYLRHIIGQGGAKVKVCIGRLQNDPKVPENGSEHGASGHGAGDDQRRFHMSEKVAPLGQQGQVDGEIGQAWIGLENGMQTKCDKGQKTWIRSARK